MENKVDMYCVIELGTVDLGYYFERGFPRLKTGQKLRATFLAAYCAVQIDTRII